MKRFMLFALSILFSFAVLAAGEDSGGNDLGKIYKQLGLDQTISYTAQMFIGEAKDGAKPQIFQMSYKNGDIRTEGEQSGMKFTMIMKKDSTIFSYNDAMKKWIKTSMNDVMGKETKLPEYKNLGTEDIEGKSCTKYEAVDASTGLKNIVWVNEGMIFKNTNIGSNGEEQSVYYKNIEKKNLEDSLFSPPPGEEVQDMSEMMKALMAGAQAQK